MRLIHTMVNNIKEFTGKFISLVVQLWIIVLVCVVINAYTTEEVGDLIIIPGLNVGSFGEDFRNIVIKCLYSIYFGVENVFVFEWQKNDNFESIVENFEKYMQGYMQYRKVKSERNVMRRAHPAKNVSIIGLSMGGVIALNWYEKYHSNHDIHKIITIAAPINGSYLLEQIYYLLGNSLFERIYGNVSYHLLNKKIEKSKLDNYHLDKITIIQLSNAFINFDGILFLSDQNTSAIFGDQLNLFRGKFSVSFTFHMVTPLFDPRIIYNIKCICNSNGNPCKMLITF